MQSEELETRFAFHPATEETGPKHDEVRRHCLILAGTLIAPECREQSLAITALEEAMMWANAAIARRS